MNVPKRNSMTPDEYLAEAVSRQYSRREIIKRATALGFSMPVIAAILAACGDDEEDEPAQDEPEVGTDPTEPEEAAEETTETESAEPTAESEGEGDATSEPEDGETAAPEDPGSSGEGLDASGSIVISLATELLSLEHDEASSIAGHPILRNIMEALTNRDPETMELVPELALSWEQTDDVTWRFTLREGVTFHNGEPFTAEVAAYGLNYTFNPESGFSLLVFMGPQISATAVDEYTLDVTTEEPDAILPSRLYFAPIPSMMQLEEDPESALDNAIGTGPYTFVEWARGQYVRLTANPDWWGLGGTDPYGEVTIQDAEMQFRTESTVRAAQLTAGEAHIANSLTFEDCQVAPVCETAPSTETLFLRPDMMHAVLGDIRIREAIALSLDMEAVAEQIYPGAVVASQIYGPATFGYNDALEPYPYDPDQAAALVEEAAADGVPIDMLITVSTRNSVAGDSDFVQYVVEQLIQIGLNAESLILENALFTAEVWDLPRDGVAEDRGWLTLIPHGNELLDASASFGRYYSCDTVVSDGTYCNEELEPRIQETLGLAGDERQQAYEEMAQLVYDEYATIAMMHLPFNYGMVEGVNWTPRLDTFILLKEMSLS